MSSLQAMTTYSVSKTNDESVSEMGDEASAVRAVKAMGVVHDRYGQPDEVLYTEQIEVGPVGPDEVLLEVEAASLNPLDWHFTTGTPLMLRVMAGFRAPKSRVRGRDVAGRVIAVGNEVTNLSVGDLVFGGVDGSFAEYATAKPHNLAVVPDGCSAEEAAAVPIAAATALQAIDDHAPVKPGQRVLVNGAAGGVGTMAVQIAVARGAEVVGVCSAKNVGMIKRLGASQVIDYTSADSLAAARAAGPFEVIIDGVGNWSTRELKSLLTESGAVVAFSGPKKNPLVGPFLSMIRKQLAFRFGSQSYAQFTATLKDSMDPIAALLASGDLRPEIHRTISLDEVPAALAELGEGHTPSKVVVQIAAD